MTATITTFPGLPRQHNRLQWAGMVGLWRIAVTVAMYRIVCTEARPPHTRRRPRYWPLSLFGGDRQAKMAGAIQARRATP